MNSDHLSNSSQTSLQEVDTSRRAFLKSIAGLAALGLPVPFLDQLPTGFSLVGLAQETPVSLEGKRGLRILSDRPVNAETPVTLLDDELTPNEYHFIRNNGHLPARDPKAPLSDWKLTIDGEVSTPLTLTLEQLKNDFPRHQGAYVIECGGNGRAGFYPPSTGNQWTLGAVGCSLYEGVRLVDVLAKACIKPSAVYLAYQSEDIHLSGDPRKDAISRGFPIAKALDPNTMLAWSMNGESLPLWHGFPLRLVCPGWPGSTSGKWLKRLWIRDRVHDGAKMTGDSYKMPRYPVAPGTTVPEEDMDIIEEMPVKSIITRPGTGISLALGESLPIRGHAWSGYGNVTALDLSIDFGTTWLSTKLHSPRNRYAWQRWESALQFPKKGYYEIWARATDETGSMQPMVVPGWNPKGYLNNAMQRIAVKVV